MKNISKCLLMLSLFLSGCGMLQTGNSNQPEANSSEEQTSENAESTIDQEDNVAPTESPEAEVVLNDSSVVKITYSTDYLESSQPVGARIEDSYFSRKLTGDELAAYESLVASSVVWENEVDINDLSFESMYKVMNILICDTPVAYALEPRYGYSINPETGLINHIHLNYEISQEEYEEILTALNSNIRAYEGRRAKGDTEYTVLGDAINFVSQITPIGDFQEEFIKTYSLVAGKVGYKQRSNSFTVARALNLLLHHAGIDSLVAVSAPKQKQPDLDIASKIFVVNPEIQEVNINFVDFNWFNEVKLNDEWYICDLYSQLVFNNSNNLSLGSTKIADSTAFLCLTTDERYAGYHTWWFMDEYFGTMPCCTSPIFLAAYRNGDYVPMPDVENPSDEYLINYIALFQKKLIEGVINQTNKSSNVFICFENKELYDIYRRTFPNAIKNTDVDGHKIEDYEVAELGEYYILYFSNFYSY